jgi:hypothetical protein
MDASTKRVVGRSCPGKCNEGDGDDQRARKSGAELHDYGGLRREEVGG